jgi:SAM-dependent methyltransferase
LHFRKFVETKAMLEGYERLPNGVIRQLNPVKIEYDEAYSAAYNGLGEKANYMAYLRLGILLGVLGKSPRRLLDVGYGNGAFLRAASKAIAHCAGCDLSPYPVPEGCERVASPSDGAWDVVCFFDSLEHFDDISIVSNLRTEYVFIAVPWCHYVDDAWFARWHHRKPNEHLWHFDKAALLAFFAEHGYACVYSSNAEDAIRQNPSVGALPNILSAIFKRRVAPP